MKAEKGRAVIGVAEMVVVGTKMQAVVGCLGSRSF